MSVTDDPPDFAFRLHVDVETWAAMAVMHPADDGRHGNILAALTDLLDQAHDVVQAVPNRPTAQMHAAEIHALAEETATVLRGFLSRWLPLWAAFKNTCPAGVSIRVQEQSWEHAAAFDAAQSTLSTDLSRISALLGEASGTSLRYQR